MRKFLVGLVAFGMLGIAADAATSAKKKSASKRATKQTVATHKTVGTAKTRTTRTASTASQRGRKAPVRRTTWRNRQLTPTPERYKEIQQALAAKGYLSPGEATGKWDDSSTDALKKFQADQNLNGNGKINSLSLIALGLGPKRETASAGKPAVPNPAAPAPAPPAVAP